MTNTEIVKQFIDMVKKLDQWFDNTPNKAAKYFQAQHDLLGDIITCAEYQALKTIPNATDAEDWRKTKGIYKEYFEEGLSNERS